jgi:hypothetical protein
MTGNLGVEYKDFLHTYGIAGSHHSRNVMGVEYVFKHHGQVGLSFGKYTGQLFMPSRCHVAKISIHNGLASPHQTFGGM